MIKRWNTDKCLNDIYLMRLHATDPRATGYETWPIKQDLYKIKWAVDQALKDCPEFAGENEFLKEHEKDLIWKALNEKTNR